MAGIESDWAESGLDEFVDAYEAAQARDGHADLAVYLPEPDHPLYLVVLCELVRVDLEYAWTRGRPRRLEDYRSEFPALFRDRSLLRQVAFEESRLRRQVGETPAPGEYLRRFGIDDLPEPASRRAPAASERCGSLACPETRRGSALWHTLRESDPPMADRLADALSMLPQPGTDFAGFHLVRELGRGAFSRVYLALQGDLADRPVALKVSADLFGEPQALARLQHTHIVPIYSAHQVGPLRAVCMPYFGAATLGDVLRNLNGRGAPPESGAALVDALASLRAGPDLIPSRPAAHATSGLETLRRLGYVQAVLWIGTRLAEGLAHAHERGIIHRDLKPANVLLTDEGQPMLLDFNLAADTRHGGSAAAAQVGGTLPYMAPEALQALRTGPQLADSRGDIYALGVILGELLTGRHPFLIRRGAVDAVLVQMVQDRLGPPPRLREANPAVTPATESIVRRCLEPDPKARYQDAHQLLEDLQRQLDDRPLRHAPEPSLRERAHKWVRRHPRLSLTGVLGGLAALLLALLVAGYDRQRRFGPVEAALAFRQLCEDHEEARILLLDPASDPMRREAGIAACRRALDRYGVLASRSWQQSPLVQDLAPGDRPALWEHLGELLLLGARGQARQASGFDPARRAPMIQTALRWNRLAETCYRPATAPRVLWDQRCELATLAGDGAAAEQARAQAAAAGVRSPRDYALLFLDAPGRAAVAAALPALAEASRRDPRDFALWMNLGQCQAAQGRPGDAEDCFTIAIVLRPGSPWPYFQRGLVELERKDYAQARLDFDQVLRLRPGLAAALVDRALARLGQGDDAGAIQDLTAAQERGASETRIYFIRAEARARSGDPDGAARDRAEGLRQRPADAVSWVARGLARLPADPAAALADFDAALKLDPDSRPALQNKAAVLSDHLGRAAEAIPLLDRTVALYPDFTPARAGRGVLLARLGRRQEALRDAEEARRRDRSGETTYRVACIYALTSRTDPEDRPRALRMLAGALGQEKKWLEIARTDPDLDVLRGHRAFRDLLQAFSGRPDAGG
jgi:serine/threonine protein kinase/predicted Zn-dependent protease